MHMSLLLTLLLTAASALLASAYPHEQQDQNENHKVTVRALDEHVRLQRSILADRHPPVEICRRYPLYVSFEDSDWRDWIVAPRGYNAFYCQGYCPYALTDYLNSTNHAFVQNVAHLADPSLVPETCCVPTSLAPISIIQFDEENRLVRREYQDMMVVGCGCR